MIKEKRQIMLEDKVVLSHFSFKPPLIASADLDNQACFVFPINTRGAIYRYDGKREVDEKSGVLMKCGQYINKWRAIDPQKDAEVVIIRLYPHILQSILDRGLQSTIKENYFKKTAPLSTVVVELDELLMKYLESLMFYFDNPQLVNDEIVLLKIKELTLLLLNSGQPNPINELLFRLFEPVKYDIKKVVDANIFENLSIEELAALSNMSISTFKRKFKEFIGESPGQYIKNRRLERAAHELKNSEKRITEISFDLGFNDPNYFTKSFSAKYGLSPRAFRKDEYRRT